MAGLGRAQNVKNTLLGLVAYLLTAGNKDGRRKAAIAAGHPIARKYVRTQNVARATGRDLPPYQGYCSGVRFDPATGKKVRRVAARSTNVIPRGWLSRLWSA